MLVGIIVIAIATFTDSVLKIKGFIQELTEEDYLYEEISEDQLKKIKLHKSHTRVFSHALEISEILYSKENQWIDIRIRNLSEETMVINGIFLHLEYLNLDELIEHNAYIEPTAVISIDNKEELKKIRSEDKQKELKRAKLTKAKAAFKPITMNKGYWVSFKLEPKGADRYIFKLPIELSSLKSPRRAHGFYRLRIEFSFNEKKYKVRFVNINSLI